MLISIPHDFYSISHFSTIHHQGHWTIAYSMIRTFQGLHIIKLSTLFQVAMSFSMLLYIIHHDPHTSHMPIPYNTYSAPLPACCTPTRPSRPSHTLLVRTLDALGHWYAPSLSAPSATMSPQQVCHLSTQLYTPWTDPPPG